MTIQRKVKGLIVENDINQEILAKEIGITREMINRKINGRSNFTLNEAFTIANYFNKTVDEIFLPSELTQKELM